MTLDTSDYFAEPMFVEPESPERFEGRYAYDSGGRLAMRHRNSYPTAPEPKLAYDKAQDAADALLDWADEPGDLPPEALADVVTAYNRLHDLTYELPRVYGFVCRYELRATAFSRRVYSEFSAHESMVEAIKWAKVWERVLPRGEYGDGTFGPWEIAWAPVKVNAFRAFGTDPEKFIREF